MINIQLQRPKKNRPWKRLWLTVILFLLLLIYMPVFVQGDSLTPILHGTVWAQEVSKEGEETKPCSSCHSEETEAWQRSLHAAQDTGGAGASCTDCHGDYVRGHPDAGIMSLAVDSSNCGDCHAATYDQWEHSLHAGEGVQCISCHTSHDQELRLTDEKLCSSCHLESVNDSLHSAHWQGEVACTNCHLTDMTNHQSLASSDPLQAISLAPTHDFVTVSAAMCLDCHRDDVKLQTDDPVNPAQPAPEVANKLESAEKSNQFLAMLSTVNLGFGIGIGGILGMLFVLVVATMNKRSDRA